MAAFGVDINMMKPHEYQHLDYGDHPSNVTVVITTRMVAEQVDALNYGTHRLLSHLIDVRRERLAKRVAKYREEGSDDVADNVEREGDWIANGLVKLFAEHKY